MSGHLVHWAQSSSLSGVILLGNIYEADQQDRMVPVPWDIWRSLNVTLCSAVKQCRLYNTWVIWSVLRECVTIFWQLCPALVVTCSAETLLHPLVSCYSSPTIYLKAKDRYDRWLLSTKVADVPYAPSNEKTGSNHTVDKIFKRQFRLKSSTMISYTWGIGMVVSLNWNEVPQCALRPFGPTSRHSVLPS